MKIIYPKDAINRRLYKGLIIVKTAIYRVSCLNRTVLAYIEVLLEEGDPKMLSKALKNVIEAKGGIEQFSVQFKQVYEKLEQILSRKD